MEPNDTQSQSSAGLSTASQERPKRNRVAPKFLTIKGDAEESKSTKGSRKTTSRRTETSGAKRKRENMRKRASTIQQHRKERKRMDRKAREGKKNEGGKIVTEDFWEMEKVVDRRVRGNKVEYLIRWKGLPESQNTWEPPSNLCDTAMAEALRFAKKQKVLQQKREEDEKRLGLGPPEVKLFEIIGSVSQDDNVANQGLPTDEQKDAPSQHVEPGESIPKTDSLPDERKEGAKSEDIESGESNLKVDGMHDAELPLQWNDEEQITFRSVVRINVNDSDARDRVTEARENGTPVVLVGHIGWANFAKGWLAPQAPETVTEAETQEREVTNSEDPLSLDLSQAHKLILSRMIEDIGHEDVPVVRRNYNEENPIHGNIRAEKFLEACWPDDSSATNAGDKAHSIAPKFYLHQWQFPLADSAGRRLCHQNKPLPNGILGLDLLKFWLDLPQCKSDSPLQYLFMGTEGTMSKLHRDSGGLDISIAPIVGEKECVLVHRSDGAVCFYHLDAKLDNIDLQAYPLMSQARIWKTIIRPGEILLMPQGTYHQCRNLTPCLSYSRFHLDTVNLLPFLQSMIDGDAPEVSQDEVIWNSTTELIRIVDSYVDEIQAHVKSPTTHPNVPLSPGMIDTVKTLRCLRNVCREIARREAVKKTVKDVPLGQPSDTDNLKSERPWQKAPGVTQYAKDDTTDAHLINGEHETGDRKQWDIIVDDIDMCLHEFRYRRMAKIPAFRPRLSKAGENDRLLRNVSHDHPVNLKETNSTPDVSVVSDSAEETAAPVMVKDTDIVKAFRLLPRILPDTPGISPDIELHANDSISIRMQGKRIDGIILRIEPQMKAALLSYEEYPSLYDEYQPYERLRLPISGEAGAEIKPDDVKPGLRVVNRWGDVGEVRYS